MEVVCLDLEGVLVPEIWIGVAERTGIEELRLTTRDEPDYDALMRRRLAILAEHDLRVADVREVIAGMSPLPGAGEFLDWLRERLQVVILSDTFYQFATPLIAKLGWPSLFCNDLEIDAEGRLTGYRLRQPEQKRAAVKALKGLKFRVLAVGDSYNDLGMLSEADAGVLFRPPASVVEARPGLPVTQDYEALKTALDAVSGYDLSGRSG